MAQYSSRHLSFTAGAAVRSWYSSVRRSMIGVSVTIAITIIFAGIVTSAQHGSDCTSSVFESQRNGSNAYSVSSLEYSYSLRSLQYPSVSSYSLSFVPERGEKIPVQYSKVIGRMQRGGSRVLYPSQGEHVRRCFFCHLRYVALISTSDHYEQHFLPPLTQNPVVVWFRSFTGSVWYYIAFFFLIIGFTFFYSTIRVPSVGELQTTSTKAAV